jgi:1,4-alpha-glucan branching enzyme
VTAPRGALAVVLHSHMPYVEGFGTWPFGEEWLWEAIATSYLPLLDVLDELPGRVTLSVTPVLADQLEAPGALDRCLAFLREIRAETHRRDLAGRRAPEEAAALEYSAAVYAGAAEALAAGDLMARLARHVAWTSAATHPVLPLLASDAGVRLQLATGIAAHRARFGDWAGGLWLPECAHASWLDPLLEEAGVHAVCVDLTDTGLDPHIPLRSAAGPLLVPLDRPALELVWHPDGYPARPPYRDTHALTEYHHQAWAVDGGPYEPARAAAQAVADAREFVAAVGTRVARGGLCVVALDTELLGTHWHEGPQWLRAVLVAAEEAGLPVLPLDAALIDREPAAAPALPVTSWGTPRDLTTWSAPAAGGLAWRARAAELAAMAAAPGVSDRALRELLALQSSDWAFLVSAATAGDYPAQRFAGHEAAFMAARSDPRGGEPALRHLAPHLVRASLAAP